MTVSAGKPLVAVCTPVYNGAKFIRDAIECVQAQTYDNIVHVIRDNASKDATPDIIAEYTDTRIPIIRHRAAETVPIMPNWNACVRMSPAEARWVRLLCVDDLMTADAIEKMVAAAVAHPTVGVVGCGRMLHGKMDNFDWPEGRVFYTGAEAIRMTFARMGTVYAPHTLVRRDLLLSRDRPFDETMFGADTDMCMRLLASSDFAYLHDILAVTREHDETVSATAMVKKRLHFFDWLVMMDRHCPAVFGPDEFQRLRALYMRYYHRKMLMWPREVRQEHTRLLAAYGETVDTWDFVDAIGNWAAKRLGLAPGWTGYPF